MSLVAHGLCSRAVQFGAALLWGRPTRSGSARRSSGTPARGLRAGVLRDPLVVPPLRAARGGIGAVGPAAAGGPVAGAEAREVLLVLRVAVVVGIAADLGARLVVA